MSKKTVTLSKRQIARMFRMAGSFPDIDRFEVEEDSSNGIGPVVTFVIPIHPERSIRADLTELETW